MTPRNPKQGEIIHRELKPNGKTWIARTDRETWTSLRASIPELATALSADVPGLVESLVHYSSCSRRNPGSITEQAGMQAAKNLCKLETALARIAEEHRHDRRSESPADSFLADHRAHGADLLTLDMMRAAPGYLEDCTRQLEAFRRDGVASAELESQIAASRHLSDMLGNFSSRLVAFQQTAAASR